MTDADVSVALARVSYRRCPACVSDAEADVCDACAHNRMAINGLRAVLSELHLTMRREAQYLEQLDLDSATGTQRRGALASGGSPCVHARGGFQSGGARATESPPLARLSTPPPWLVELVRCALDWSTDGHTADQIAEHAWRRHVPGFRP